MQHYHKKNTFLQYFWRRNIVKIVPGKQDNILFSSRCCNPYQEYSSWTRSSMQCRSFEAISSVTVVEPRIKKRQEKTNRTNICRCHQEPLEKPPSLQSLAWSRRSQNKTSRREMKWCNWQIGLFFCFNIAAKSNHALFIAWSTLWLNCATTMQARSSFD